MRLIQIPFSHNCVKVRRALELKGLDFTTLDIQPMRREPVISASKQPLVPALEDDGTVIADSTAILEHLERRHPERPLLPATPAGRTECWLLEDWADSAFMEKTRRIAYWQTLLAPDLLAGLWFPQARGLRRRLMLRGARRVLSRRFHLSAARNRRDEREVRRSAALAVERLGGRPWLVGDAVSVADIALAAMTAPLAAAAAPLRDDPAVAALLAWGETVLGSEIVALYKPGDRAA